MGLVFLAGLVWCSFQVPLGELTFAQHMDRIGQTPEAKGLLDGSRKTIAPVMDEATDRMLGEYIEAPTHASTVESAVFPSSPGVPQSAGPPRPMRDRTKPSTDESTKLPGR